MKGTVELSAMPEVTTDAAVEFSDWLYVVEQTIGAITDSAARWFATNLACAREAYARYQQSSALERLSISPLLPPELLDAKWQRLERRVMSLFLAAMTKSVREEAVTHRVSTVAGLLYRVHVLYAPGGSSERAAILRQLEGQGFSGQPSEVMTQLRKWRRYLSRAVEMGLTPPGPSVQLRGVEAIIAKTVEQHQEVSFRLSLARNQLQLQYRPTQDTVLQFYNHAFAELQQVAALKNKQAMTTAEAAKLKTLQPAGLAPTSPSSSTKGKTPCKFFLSDGGCRKGQQCSYCHDFGSKEETRCWQGGSRQHRQSDCPVQDPTRAKQAKGSGKTSSSSASTSAPS